MSMTIKELAEKLGVSKTAVRKYLTPEFRERYTTTSETGAILVSDEGANQLGSLRKPLQNTANQFAETTANQVPSDIIEVLTEQLRKKDELILSLQEELAKEREHSREQSDRFAQLADQAQHLQAQSQKLLTDGSSRRPWQFWKKGE